MSATLLPSKEYIKIEMVVTVTCPDCDQTDCENANELAEKVALAVVAHRDLEHSLATAFVEMQRSFKVEERQAKWFECLRLASELEKLNAGTTTTTTDGNTD